MIVTVKYGIDRMEKDVPAGTTIGQLIANESLKAGLGYGDNVKALMAGQEMPMEAGLFAGASVTLETRANAKAQIPPGMKAITLKYGCDSFTKVVDADTTIEELLDDPNIEAALGFGDNVKPMIGGVEQSEGVNVPAGSTVVLETRANEKALAA